MGSEEDRHKMILPVVSSLLLASVAFGAPGANYGAAAHVSPAKQISSPSIQCRTEYVTLWDTEYQEREEQVCETVYEKQCETRTQRLCQPTTRQECTTNYVKECSTIYKNVCVQKFRTEYEPYTESECTTEYKQDCQYEWRGHGNDKVWAPIEGTCQNVAYEECSDVPEQKCVSVPKQTCVTVPDQICKTEPLTECQDVPRQQCHSEHKRFPVRISRQAPKKVCDEVHSTAPLAAAAVHQAPVHHQASPSVQDLLNYGVPAVPTQTVPQIIDARDKQKLQSAAKDDRIVFA